MARRVPAGGVNAPAATTCAMVIFAFGMRREARPSHDAASADAADLAQQSQDDSSSLHGASGQSDYRTGGCRRQIGCLALGAWPFAERMMRSFSSFSRRNSATHSFNVSELIVRPLPYGRANRPPRLR